MNRDALRPRGSWGFGVICWDCFLDDVGDRPIRRVEVESVAFIVCNRLARDWGDYRFTYVTPGAEGSTDLVKETAERHRLWEGTSTGPGGDAG